MEKFEEKIEPKKEKEPEIQRPEFEIEEFEKSRESFENLTKQLTPAIQRHEYNLIIGDDTSGRLPVRVIGDLLKEVYKEDKAKAPKIKFLVGKQWCEQNEKAELDNYLQKIIKEEKISPEKTKVLLVTEYMESGRHATYFIRGLKKVGLSCDVATLSIVSSSTDYKKLPDFKNVKMYIGAPGGELYFYKRPFSGVEKHGRQVLAKRREEDRDEVLAARQDAKKMVDYLKQIYDREKEKTEK